MARVNSKREREEEGGEEGWQGWTASGRGRRKGEKRDGKGEQQVGEGGGRGKSGMARVNSKWEREEEAATKRGREGGRSLTIATRAVYGEARAPQSALPLRRACQGTSRGEPHALEGPGGTDSMLSRLPPPLLLKPPPPRPRLRPRSDTSPPLPKATPSLSNLLLPSGSKLLASMDPPWRWCSAESAPRRVALAPARVWRCGRVRRGARGSRRSGPSLGQVKHETACVSLLCLSLWRWCSTENAPRRLAAAQVWMQVWMRGALPRVQGRVRKAAPPPPEGFSASKERCPARAERGQSGEGGKRVLVSKLRFPARTPGTCCGAHEVLVLVCGGQILGPSSCKHAILPCTATALAMYCDCSATGAALEAGWPAGWENAADQGQMDKMVRGQVGLSGAPVCVVVALARGGRASSSLAILALVRFL
eukprot:354660-Chlamydomonas_euryale.AAC.1